MKKSKSNFPIGAEWQHITSSGEMFFIEFNRMHGNTEIWVFGRILSDGSGYKSDQTTSYNSAKRNHYIHNVRFKRVK